MLKRSSGREIISRLETCGKLRSWDRLKGGNAEDRSRADEGGGADISNLP